MIDYMCYYSPCITHFCLKITVLILCPAYHLLVAPIFPNRARHFLSTELTSCKYNPVNAPNTSVKETAPLSHKSVQRTSADCILIFDDYKFVSLNVKGLNSPFKRKLMWSEAQRLKGDVLCIQETYFLATKAPKCSHRQYPHIVFANAETKHNGILKAIRNTAAFSLHDVITDPKGHYTVLLCTMNNFIYTIISVYAPNQGQITFLRNLLKKVKSLCEGNLLLLGDINLVIESKVDCSPPKLHHTSTLHSTIHNKSLYDVWRCHHPDEKDFTFFSNPHKSYSRIDLILTDLPSLYKDKLTIIDTITWSDQAPITIEMEEQFNVSPTILWHINTRIFNHTDHLEKVRKQLEEFFHFNDTDETSASNIWCDHKAYIIDLLLQIAASKKKLMVQANKSLLAKIHHLETQNNRDMTQALIEELKSCRTELKQVLLYDYENGLKCLKASCYFSGNKAGKVLAQQLKAKQAKQV